ncbi:MAG: hypothetical protein GQ570_03300 [Helicobacteraceae bacterium]|nr:hypothetical protein [Helicobacteraceae bacterium]
MKKLILGVILLPIIIVIGAYFWIFSEAGNAFIASNIKAQADKALKLDTKVEGFKLTKDHLEFKIFLTPKNFIEVSGDFSVFDQKFKGSHVISFADLLELEPLLEQKLNGKILLKGDMEADSKEIELNSKAYADLAGASFEIEMKNFNDVEVEIKNLHSLAALKMLNYPQLIDATVNSKTDYDLSSKKAKIKTELFNIHFMPNSLLNTIKTYSGTDPYKEIFKADVITNVDGEYTISTLNFSSKNIIITSKDAALNTKSKNIDASFDIDINKNVLVVGMKGNVNKPELSVDASKMVKDKAKDYVTKEVNKHLGKDNAKMVNDFINKLF